MRVLITGANRGIGRAMFDQYSAAGDQVIGTTRGGASGDDWITLDVTDRASHRAMAARMGAAPLDLLICNAGVYLDKGQELDRGYPARQWADTFAANVGGVFQTIQTLLPNLRAAKGKIAIISSIMASSTTAPGGSYIYRSSKAAVLNLGRNLAVDLKPDGVAVGIYHPGWVRTDMGGSTADISVEESVTGLTTRFAALDVSTTGCFEFWDGSTHPF